MTALRTWLPLLVFLASYAGFVLLPRRRALIACGAATLLLATGLADGRAAVSSYIPWNVLALLAGMMLLAELFNLSRMPAVIAERLARRCGNAFTALFLMVALAGGFSTFLDNVSVVLLLAPVTIGVTRRLRIDPTTPLICLAVAANLEGTATLIGDPPSMLLAGHLKLSFNDFFLYKGRPGIFWAVQAGAVAAFGVVAWLLRRTRQPAHLEEAEPARSTVPSWLVATLVVCLAAASRFDPDFRWLAGTLALSFAAAGCVWYVRIARWGHVRDLLKGLDLQTLGFLLGMFVLVGSLNEAGWLQRIAAAMAGLVGGNIALAYVGIVLFSVTVSAVVDNVPFLLAMIPVTQSVADRLGAPTELLMFGLLIGSCLGGNVTPIGASANVVAIGILRREGYHPGFRTFMRVGLPFTAAAVLAGSLFVWHVWR